MRSSSCVIDRGDGGPKPLKEAAPEPELDRPVEVVDREPRADPVMGDGDHD
jgi:hypothetical protein